MKSWVANNYVNTDPKGRLFSSLVPHPNVVWRNTGRHGGNNMFERHSAKSAIFQVKLECRPAGPAYAFGPVTQSVIWPRSSVKNMTDKNNEILAREISKLGGGFASREVAKRLPDNTYEVKTEITAPPKLVLETAFDILSQLGRITDNIESASELPTIYAVVGSGFFNLNPTMVTVQVSVASDTLTQASICGTAKEGLIKQRAGEKAAKRIAAVLNEAFSKKIYLKIKNTTNWDFGPGIEYHLVEINLQGFVHRIIDLDIDQIVVSFSPSSLNVHGATDHSPFSMESGENRWDEFAVHAEEFERHWQEALKMEKRAI